MEFWLFKLVTVGNQAANDVDPTVDGTAVTRMFDLRDVLELVNHRLDDRALASEQLVSQLHQLVLHVAPRLGKELNVEGFEQLLSELL